MYINDNLTDWIEFFGSKFEINTEPENAKTLIIPFEKYSEYKKKYPSKPIITAIFTKIDSDKFRKLLKPEEKFTEILKLFNGLEIIALGSFNNSEDSEDLSTDFLTEKVNIIIRNNQSILSSFMFTEYHRTIVPNLTMEIFQKMLDNLGDSSNILNLEFIESTKKSDLINITQSLNFIFATGSMNKKNFFRQFNTNILMPWMKELEQNKFLIFTDDEVLLVKKNGKKLADIYKKSPLLNKYKLFLNVESE